MLLSDKHILEFQGMWLEHFGKQISKEEAYDRAIKLIEFVEVATQPLTDDDLLNVDRSRKEIKEKLG